MSPTMILAQPGVADGPTLEEVIAEWQNAGSGLVAVSALARDIGADPASMRKRVRKMGLHMEYAWIRDVDGRRQSSLCTDAAGALALRAWYAR